MGTKPKKNKKKFVPEQLTEDELKYIYRNRKGRVIFTPLYKIYNKLFFDEIIENTSITTAFEKFQATSIFERYMLNAAQFSAAKSAAEAKLLQAEVFNDDKTVRPYPEFKKAAKEITTISQETWLRVEYDICKRQSVQGELFRQMMEDSDLYPYWVYHGVMDDREREEHVALEGKVFRIGDDESDECFPPNDWNCRCTGDPADDQFLSDNKLSVVSNDEAKQLLNSDVDEQFRYNPATAGMMPNTGSYFEALPSANKADWEDFGLDEAAGDEDLTGLAAKGMHYLLTIMDEWRKDHHEDKNGDIIFQNDQLLSNVKFTSNSLHQVQAHNRGFENIPSCITSPDEVWSRWEDENKQRVVLRSYIKFGRTSYIVQTRDGVITDAWAISNKALNNKRKGVLL